eukprot:scaffold243834_cov14-Tisochrysis_lutea.AAC.1
MASKSCTLARSSFTSLAVVRGVGSCSAMCASTAAAAGCGGYCCCCCPCCCCSIISCATTALLLGVIRAKASAKGFMQAGPWEQGGEAGDAGCCCCGCCSAGAAG